jgi:hypothetical protein
VATLLVGCRTDSDLDRFDQTWEAPLGETNCAEWIDDMTDSQRFAAAAELMLSARADAPGFPSDGQFTFYMSRVSAACEDAGAEAVVADVAAAVYAEDEGLFSE